MKGLILASLLSLATASLMTLVFRFNSTTSKLRLALLIYLCSLLGLLAAFAGTPENLGFLPADLVGEPRWLELLIALFVFSASFFGGWLQLYNLATRGYSLHVLIDLLARQQRSATGRELASAYAAGQGLDWMYRRRLAGLEALRLIAPTDAGFELLPRGQRIALIFGKLRKWFGVSGAI